MPEVSDSQVEDLLRQYFSALQTAELPPGLAATVSVPPPGASQHPLKPRWGRIALVIVVLLAILAGLIGVLTHSGGTTKPGGSTTATASPVTKLTRNWDLAPINATFMSELFATQYAARVTPAQGATALPPLTARWTLSLQLVDAAGAPDPGTYGSGAGVDPGCNNAGDGTTMPSTASISGGNATTTFTWHHPDAASDPTGTYHCQHSLQGPHGHQGRVTLTVSDGLWQCIEFVDGTHDTQSGSPDCTLLKG